MPFWFSKFRNVPRYLGPQELVPLVQVPKPPTIHYEPATKKLFDSPECPFFLFSLVANYCTNIFMLTSQVSNITKYFDFCCKNSYTVEPLLSRHPL